MVEFKETEVKKIDKIFVSAAGLRSLADRLEAQFKDTKTEVAVDLYVVPSGENKAIGFDFSAYLKKEDPKPVEPVKIEPEVKETTVEPPKTVENKSVEPQTPVVDPNVSTDDKKAPEATVATPEEVEKQKQALEEVKKVAEEQKAKEEAAKKEEEIKKNADAVKVAAEKLMSTEETK